MSELGRESQERKRLWIHSGRCSCPHQEDKSDPKHDLAMEGEESNPRVCKSRKIESIFGTLNNLGIVSPMVPVYFSFRPVTCVFFRCKVSLATSRFLFQLNVSTASHEIITNPQFFVLSGHRQAQQ